MNSTHRFPDCVRMSLIAWMLAGLAPSGVAAKGPDAGSEEGTPFRALETTYESGDLTIAATLLVPATKEKCPASIIIQGSGPSSRKNHWALMIGEHLARRGVVTFLPDKRGTGDSTGDWRTAGFEELAGDIVAAIASLEQRPEVDPGSIGVVGLSQGGFYAPLVANRSDRISFVVTVSSSLLPFADTVNHEMRNTFRKEGLSGAELEQAMAVQYAAIEVARGGKWQEYERVRREAMAAVPSDAIAGFPAEPDHWICAWAPKVVNWDPLVQWRAVSRPMFFAFGADDEEDNVPVQASLALIRKELEPGRDVTVRVYPDSGHALWDPVLARRGEGVVRTDFIEDLVSWIDARSSRGAD